LCPLFAKKRRKRYSATRRKKTMGVIGLDARALRFLFRDRPIQTVIGLILGYVNLLGWIGVLSW